MTTYLKNLGLVLSMVHVLLTGCSPKSLPIEVPQDPPKIALSSIVIDASTVFVTATYSVSSLSSLNDLGVSSASSTGLIGKLSIANAVVVLRSAASHDTLPQVYAGVYGSTSLTLRPNVLYTLSVLDKAAGVSVSASCSYVPLVTVNAIKPIISRTTNSTTVTLHVDVQDDPARTDYFVMSYSNKNPATIPSALGGTNFQALAVSSQKMLELFSDADAAQGRIVRDFTLTVNPTDTLYTNVSRIEKGFFDYLTAYKRSGSTLDFASEPIPIPTNVLPGLGYFYLHETKRSAFILNQQ